MARPKTTAKTTVKTKLQKLKDIQKWVELNKLHREVRISCGEFYDYMIPFLEGEIEILENSFREQHELNKD